MRSNAVLKAEAMSIFQAGLDAVDPYHAVRSRLERSADGITVSVDGEHRVDFGVDDFNRVVVVGAGKATARMCQAAEDSLGDRLAGGLIVVKEGYTAELDRVRTIEAAHPVPDASGVEGAGQILTLLDALDERTLVIALISGGGSALLPGPAPGITLRDKQKMTDLLLAAGADIREMNTVRKHISSVKGGQLARRAHPAAVVSLILSDVVGDPLDAIASGPTVPDASTFRDARAVLERYGLVDRAPASVASRIARGVAGEIAETPKAGDPVFERCTNVLVGTNRQALRACMVAAEARGWNTLLLSSLIEGETRDVARVHAAMALEVRRSGLPLRPPACLVSGGETTVTLRGKGKGGRNQEFALAAALDLAGEKGVAILSAGTDGTDGPTDAAGAIAFGDTVARGTGQGREAVAHLRNNDAYPFFDDLGDLIKTGPTNTNVMDVHLVLVDG